MDTFKSTLSLTLWRFLLLLRPILIMIWKLTLWAMVIVIPLLVGMLFLSEQPTILIASALVASIFVMLVTTRLEHWYDNLIFKLTPSDRDIRLFN